MRNTIEAAKALLAQSRTFDAPIAKAVNAVRSDAHVLGVLTPEDEATFQHYAARFGGFMVRGKLADLPTEGPDGNTLPALKVPEQTRAIANHAPYGFEAADAAEYNAGYEIGLQRAQLDVTGSMPRREGWLAGFAAATGESGTSPADLRDAVGGVEAPEAAKSPPMASVATAGAPVASGEAAAA